MAPLSITLANRIGFIILGLTNNFAYIIMLSAAYDLLHKTSSDDPNHSGRATSPDYPQVNQTINSTSKFPQPYCNEHSTSTILLADILPSLSTKIVYSFCLVGIPTAYKVVATAALSAAAFIITGLSSDQLLIFTGVICASFSSGLGESTYVSKTPLYGDASLIGWSMGTGAAGLLGAAAYALLRMVCPIRIIMIVMLVIPIAMIYAYFFIITPISQQEIENERSVNIGTVSKLDNSNGGESGSPNQQTNATMSTESAQRNASTGDMSIFADNDESFGFREQLRFLPSLSKYFMPLLLVYFAEYFINQGLFELIYYDEVSNVLDKPAQYRWFQVSYQLGVMISRSSLDLFQIKNLWAMSLLQAANSALFLAHATMLIHLPTFYLVILLIIYEGLLGGFTYVNTFYRIKKEIEPSKLEFSISTVTIADSLGIVMAGLVALPVHDSLCKLYKQ